MDALPYILTCVFFMCVITVSFLALKKSKLSFIFPVAANLTFISLFISWYFSTRHLINSDGYAITAVMRFFMLDDHLLPENIARGDITVFALVIASVLYAVAFAAFYSKKLKQE